MSFTYTGAITSANIKLRNIQKANWDDTDMLDLMNDAVQLMRHALAWVNPFMFASNYTVPLTVAGGYGPYNLPSDFKVPVVMLDDNTPAQEVVKSNRYASHHQESPGSNRPTEWWPEEFNPTKAYFNYIPDASRSYTLYYVPTVSRETDPAQNVPLPDYCFEPLVQFVMMMAGDMDEYITKTEQDKLAMLMPLLDSIVIAASPEIQFDVEGVGF